MCLRLCHLNIHLFTNMFSFRFVQFYSRRFFSKKVKLKKRYNKKVLEQLDENYSHLYREKWDTIRRALITKHNYIALLNNFGSHTEIIELLESSGAISLHKLLKYPQNDLKASSEEPKADRIDLLDGKLQIDLEPESNLLIPKDLNIYTILGGNIHNFPQPKYCEFTNTFSHILLNGASILPPIALDVQPGDRVLDACSGPGTKALVLLQILHPFELICNEIDEKRKRRIENLFKHYVIGCDGREMLKIKQGDISECREYDSYDKILVDVPCSADRHAVQKYKAENESNNLNGYDLTDRQVEILLNCIRLLKPGGSLVYSTCSLNPKENDGIVEAAVLRALKEFDLAIKIKDMSEAIKPYREIFEFGSSDSLKYGQLVIPTMSSNFGPIYFCKLVRK